MNNTPETNMVCADQSVGTSQKQETLGSDKSRDILTARRSVHHLIYMNVEDRKEETNSNPFDWFMLRLTHARTKNKQ